MTQKNQPRVQQTAIGNDNIQVVGSNNVITRITNFFAGDTEQQRALRNRRAMLELVQNTWIKGVLEKSLYNEVLIELGVEERFGAVYRPWDVQVKMPDRHDRNLPAETSMMEVFDETNGAMLVLGEPGSGKTTMLLELARELISRASADDNLHIPVIFNLSSWEDKQTLVDWLVMELNTKYNIPKRIGQPWVMNNDLLILLDGLDEVRRGSRDGCVKAINAFRQNYGLAPLVVCSRTADYEALTEKLNLRGAVLLQPLTTEQIEEYFEQIGKGLDSVRHELRSDPVLQEMVKLPLILSTMTIAYQNNPVERLEGENQVTLETRRRNLFDAYIKRMFERVARTKSHFYTNQQTKNSLAWLAQKLIEHNEMPYLLEGMQPDWLGRKTRWVYRLVAGLVSGLIFAIYGGLVLGLVGALGIAVGKTDVTLSDVLWASMITLLFGSPLVTFSFVGGFISGMFFGDRRINTSDRLAWEWKPAAKGLMAGLGIAMGIGMVGILAIGAQGALIAKLVIGLIAGLLLIGPIFGILGGLFGGIRAKTINQTTYPGERISLTMRNSFIAFVLTSTMVYLIILLFPIILGMTGWWQFGLILGLFLGLICGLVGGLLFGGFAIIKHYALRFILARNNHIPFRLVPFLDHCVDIIFLRRVGGGYIFVHRLLMEHFADMYTANEK